MPTGSSKRTVAIGRETRPHGGSFKAVQGWPSRGHRGQYGSPRPDGAENVSTLSATGTAQFPVGTWTTQSSPRSSGTRRVFVRILSGRTIRQSSSQQAQRHFGAVNSDRHDVDGGSVPVDCRQGNVLQPPLLVIRTNFRTASPTTKFACFVRI